MSNHLFKPILFAATLCFLTACSDHDVPTAAERLSQDTSVNASDPVSASVQAQIHAEESLALNTMNAVIKVFETTEGRFPSSLQELIDKGFITSFPPLPTNKKFAYESKDGRVEIVNAGTPDAPKTAEPSAETGSSPVSTDPAPPPTLESPIPSEPPAPPEGSSSAP